MKVLIITKPSNLELHGETVKSVRAAGGFPNSPDIVMELEEIHHEHYKTLNELKSVCIKFKIEYTQIDRHDKWPDEEFDYVVTVGGDGSVLDASQNMSSGGKLIGLKSSASSVGYLCATDINGIEGLFSKLVHNKLRFTNVMRIKALITRPTQNMKEIQTPPALNEFLFAHENPGGTSRYMINFNGTVEEQKSSGIWVSTPVGSTGSINAAGGQRMIISEQKYQFLVRELYQSSSINNSIKGAIVDPVKDNFEIENHTEKAVLSIDGTHARIKLEYGDIIKFIKTNDIELILRKNL